jgi:protein phosphatase
MGTTIVVAVVEGGHITFAGAGDSRVYRIRNDQIEQMTVDDSWVQVAINEGVLDPDDANIHPMKNIITKAIGAKENIDFQVREEQLEEGDLYLLCSDGLHGMLTDDEILKVILESNGELEKGVQDLIKAANDNGGKDNVTALLLCCGS